MSDPVFFVKPKMLNKHYRDTSYTLTYIPDTKQWKWEVIWIQSTVYGDVAKTLHLAQRAAEKHIDNTLKLRGQS